MTKRIISRAWHGRVPAAKADAYYQVLLATGLADYRRTAGNLGVVVERWVEGDAAHFLITTFWESMDAVRRFAGDQPEIARYYPEDDAYLLEHEPRVRHGEVLMVDLDYGQLGAGREPA